MRRFFLQTERLKFSVWTKEDISLAKQLWGDERVSRYISATGVFSEEDILSRLDTEIGNYEKYAIQYFPIFTKDTETFIGCCGLRPYKDEGTLEIGFHLRSEFHNQGYGYEAANAMIKYAFEEIKVKRLFAGHNPKNIISRKLLLKLGFTYTHDEFYAPTGLMHPSYTLENKNKI